MTFVRSACTGLITVVAFVVVASCGKGLTGIDALSKPPVVLAYTGSSLYTLRDGHWTEQASAFPCNIALSQNHVIPVPTGVIDGLPDTHSVAMALANSGSPSPLQEYSVAFRLTGSGSGWKRTLVAVSGNIVIVDGLQPKSAYDLRLAAVCAPGETTGYSAIVHATTN